MSIYSKQNTPFGFYIYAYVRPNGTPYYIGKGQNDRAWKKSGHIVKPPIDPQYILIMESGLTNTGALALERFYIRWYGRLDLGTGVLHNMSDGGDGTINHSPQAIDKIRRANIGRIFTTKHKKRISKGKKGLKMSEQSRKNISEGHKGLVPWNKGKKCPQLSKPSKCKGRPCHTEEWKKALSERMKGNKLSQLKTPKDKHNITAIVVTDRQI